MHGLRVLFFVMPQFLAACASVPPAPEGFYGPMQLAEPFWSAPRPIAIAVVEAPRGAVHRVDPDGEPYRGLYAARAEEPLRAFLASSRVDYAWIGDELETMLDSRGFVVERAAGPAIDRSIMAADSTFEALPRKYERALEIGAQADLVLVLIPGRWGVGQTFGDGFQMGLSYALFEIGAMLFDVANRAILWEGFVIETVPIQKTWNQPPDDAALEAALAKALRASGSALVESFAAWDGEQAAFVWLGAQ
jgi:hypothetical protein